MIALTHAVSPNLAQCELSHRERLPIDYRLACQQHAAYCQALRALGCDIVELAVNRHLPDSTFIEDTAVVVDEIAILASMGVASRRPEVAGVAPVLASYRPVCQIQPPATLEGGDVLRVGRRLYVGLSGRTNAAGVAVLRTHLEPLGYDLREVPVRDCLHLKSACCALDDETLLVNPRWLAREHLADRRFVAVPEQEPNAANILLVGGTVLMAAGFPRTLALVRDLGFSVETVDISELMKAEAAMTCSCILIDDRGPADSSRT